MGCFYKRLVHSIENRGDKVLYVAVIFSAILIGIIVSCLNGSRPSFSNIKFKNSWLLLPAVVLQILSSVAEARGYEFGTILKLIVNGTVFVLAFFVIWFNRRYLGLWFIGLGAFFNALVMMLNGGRMPVDVSVLNDKVYTSGALDLILRGSDNKHVAIESTTKIPILADIIGIPGFLGVGMPIISIGDIIVAVGLFLLCLQFIVVPRNTKDLY